MKESEKVDRFIKSLYGLKLMKRMTFEDHELLFFQDARLNFIEIKFYPSEETE